MSREQKHTDVGQGRSPGSEEADEQIRYPSGGERFLEQPHDADGDARDAQEDVQILFVAFGAAPQGGGDMDVEGHQRQKDQVVELEQGIFFG